MDSGNNQASRDTFQSRTKLTNDRYQFTNGQAGNPEKRPITANPTVNPMLMKRKMIQSQGYNLNSNSQQPQ